MAFMSPARTEADFAKADVATAKHAPAGMPVAV
jgi:hypothetical protein